MSDRKAPQGEPRRRAEFLEGKDAATNFKNAMAALLTVPKARLIPAEKERAKKN